MIEDGEGGVCQVRARTAEAEAGQLSVERVPPALRAGKTLHFFPVVLFKFKSIFSSKIKNSLFYIKKNATFITF